MVIGSLSLISKRSGIRAGSVPVPLSPPSPGASAIGPQQSGRSAQVWPDGNIASMAKDKVTITLDRAKAARARALVGSSSTSEVIDLALDRLIRAEQLRTDIAAYQLIPPTDREIQLGMMGDYSGLADETDWSGLYPEEAP